MGLQMCSITCPLNPHSLCPRISHITSGVSVSTAALLLSLVGRERDARSPSLHCLQGCSNCAEADAEHLDFVVMQRLVQRRTLACHSDQTASELAGVAKCAVSTRFIGWHDMMASPSKVMLLVCQCSMGTERRIVRKKDSSGSAC